MNKKFQFYWKKFCIYRYPKLFFLNQILKYAFNFFNLICYYFYYNKIIEWTTYFLSIFFKLF